jgi:uncharacterized protein YbjT (DUF2867 family)
MYVVTGATGHTGSIVADKLLAAGKKVHVVGRDAKRLEKFAKKDAEPIVADVTDASALTKAFSGAAAVYAMIPPNPANPDVHAYEAKVSTALIAAVKENNIRHTVVLSSFGADKPDKTGPVVGLHELEKKFGAIDGANVLFLRAGYFMENLLPQAGVIKSFGNMAGPVRADLRLPMIATQDIGTAAADALLKLNFEGKCSRELAGQRDVTYSEVAKIIGAAIGKRGLGYIQMPGAQLKPFLVQMGMSSNMADLLLEMSDSLNNGYMRMIEPRSAENSTPTSIETFVSEVWLPAYQSSAAHA